MYMHGVSSFVINWRVLGDLPLGFRRAVGGARGWSKNRLQHLFPASTDLPNQLRFSFPSRLLNYYMGCTLPCRRAIQIQDINNQDTKKSSSLCFTFPIYESFLQARLRLWS